MHAGRLTQELHVAVHFRHSLLFQGNAAHTAHMKLGWINYADPLPHSYPHHRCYRCYTFTSLLVNSEKRILSFIDIDGDAAILRAPLPAPSVLSVNIYVLHCDTYKGVKLL